MRRRLMAVITTAAVLGLADAASGMFVGVEVVQEISAESSAAVKSATATCPAGKQVTGAGSGTTIDNSAASDYLPNRSLITAVRPSPGLTSVTVTAAEQEGGTPSTWSVVARAICAPAPAGLERIAATSASSSAGKVVTASCPAGKRVTGTGAEVTGAAGQVVIDGVVPSADLTSVTVNAFEDETGTTSAWTVTAYAICASPAQALTRHAKTTASDSSSPKGDLNPCPAGKVAVGVGGEINGGGGQVHVDSLYTGFDGPGIDGWEDANGYAGDWSVTLYSICGAGASRAASAYTAPGDPAFYTEAECAAGRLPTGVGAGMEGGRGELWFNGLYVVGPAPALAPAAVWGTETARTAGVATYGVCASGLSGYLEVAGVTEGARPDDPVKTITIPCPSGKRALGGGGWSEGLEEHGMTQSLIPGADLGGSTYRVSETETGVAGGWSLRGETYCASPPRGLVRVSRASAIDSLEYKTVTATCPSGKHLLGLGVAVSPGTGQIAIDDLRPSPDLKTVTVEAVEDRNGFSGDWSVTAYAVCVDR